MSDIHILIVEDELLIAKNLSRKLKKLGYRVDAIVSSGEAAIQKAAEIKPDLILMDIVIKGEMNGIEAAATIHQQLDIPVIYTTAYADDDTLQQAEATGSYGYIIKPFKERDLHATIKIALSQHKQAIKMRQLLADEQVINQNKSRILSMASHDLRAPLTTIQMSAELLQLKADQEDERKTRHFQRIQNAVTNMNQLLEDVLTLSQAEAGKLDFQPEPLDVIALCETLREQLIPLASEQHSLNFSYQGEFPLVYFDESLLRYLLTNLLTNAIKYSPQGGNIWLTVMRNNQQVTFQVQDEGIGMPPEYLNKLFQQFERAANVGNIKGTGLGLCIVKQAVDLHGGEIMVESTVGVGTTFTVRLPFQKTRPSSNKVV